MGQKKRRVSERGGLYYQLPGYHFKHRPTSHGNLRRKHPIFVPCRCSSLIAPGGHVNWLFPSAIAAVYEKKETKLDPFDYVSLSKTFSFLKGGCTPLQGYWTMFSWTSLEAATRDVTQNVFVPISVCCVYIRILEPVRAEKNLFWCACHPTL